VIAIDGPAGAGKSTVARAVADRLSGFRYLDTGAMYRAVTAYLRRQGMLEGSGEEMARAAEGLELDGDRYLVHGIDVTGDLRSAEVTAEVSRVSAVPRVRRVVQARQRLLDGRLVAEGRDIGSVVFPDAQLKVYLDATLDERAERRHRQFPQFSVPEYREKIARRDELDSTRQDSPLRCPDDAIRIDTTDLSVEQVVMRITALAREAMDRAAAPDDRGGAAGPPHDRKDSHGKRH